MSEEKEDHEKRLLELEMKMLAVQETSARIPFIEEKVDNLATAKDIQEAVQADRKESSRNLRRVVGFFIASIVGIVTIVGAILAMMKD